METETLSNYKQVQDKHILNETMDENSTGNDELKFVESEKKSTETVDDSDACDEISNKKTKDFSDKNKTEQNLISHTISDESDNEEEEHIPLNINEINSDSDKSDDDLDESDLLQDEDKDDLEKSVENNHTDNEISTVDIQQDGNVSEEKSLDKNVSENTREDNSQTSVPPEENKQDDDVKNDQEDPLITDNKDTAEKDDLAKEIDNKSADSLETQTNQKDSVDPLKEKTTEQDTVDVNKDDVSKEANDDPLETKATEKDTVDIAEDEIDSASKETIEKKATEKDTVDIATDEIESASKESIETKATDKDIIDVADDEDDVPKEATDSKCIDPLETKSTEKDIMEIADDEGEEAKNDKSVDPVTEEQTGKDKEIVDLDDDPVKKSTDKSDEPVKESEETEAKPAEKDIIDVDDETGNDSSEENTKKDTEANKVNEINDDKTVKDDTDNKNKKTDDTGVVILEKDPLSPDKNEKSDDAEASEGKEKSSKEENSLLKESLTRERSDDGGKDNEEEYLDMDEDFDPSLLCPDINMEVDEAPVITSSDAPPPAHNRDSSKSPLLYEPIFSTYVDEMTGAEIHFDLTPDEESLRLSSFGEKNPVQYTKIHCTACNVHLGSALDGQGNRFVHPLLKVLICKNCYHFYTSGEFEKDEDGSELYCRWCGQGGQVMCCSGCEMVFCKKCIRINFDRKKLAEIRDSDDWYCFRCNPSQITFQRVHCAEFMEYVRRETQRASTLENPIAYMNVDYTQCCTSQKKKPADSPVVEQPKKKKRKITTVDPDYNPSKERDTDSPQPSTSGYKPPTTSTTSTKPNNLVLIAPKTAEPNKPSNIIQINSNSSFKIGGTTFKPRSNTVPNRPRLQVATTSGVRPTAPSPGYIKILPGGIRVPGNAPRQSFTPRPRNPVSSPIRPAVPTPMKHEWFEKTVRAAARVNSNLSYTLTQLNRAQANATSVEALAVVHNKLQEILSTSINSLIQIRKNLRTEFIAGIKNIRFPPKPQASTSSPGISTTPAAGPSTSSQDDDVIFISPTVSPVPPPMTMITSTPVTSMNSISLPPSVSLIKKPAAISPTVSTTPTGIQPQNGLGVTRPFLRVKSLTALQSVPSECITIPDDPPPPPLTPLSNTVVNSQETDKDTIEIIDDKDEEPENSTVVNGLGKVKTMVVVPLDKNKNKENKAESKGKDVTTYNLKDPLSPELKKMKGTRVLLKRSAEIDELVKRKFGKVNGDL